MAKTTEKAPKAVDKAKTKSTEKTISKEDLKKQFIDVLHNDFQTTPDEATDQQVYEALSKIVVGILKAKRRKFTVATQSAGKKRFITSQWSSLWADPLKLHSIILR